MAENSNPQVKQFPLITGSLGYRTRSDITATPPQYLVNGSQNVLINEATDTEGDKIESRLGYTLLGDESSNRYGIQNEFVFKTKTGDSILLRFTAEGVLEFYSDGDEAWEELKTGLDGSFHCRFTTVWNGTELIRELLFVNHSAVMHEWSGAMGTLASVAAGTISLNEDVATRGFLTSGTRFIRIKDSGGVWHETVYTNESGSDFTVSTDLTGFVFDANAPVVQVVRENATTPAAGFINDVIRTLDNHVYVGSHSSSVVYMSKSTNFTDFTFASPRIATDGWQFVLDDYTVGFETNIASSGEESIVFFAGDDWIYRVEFVDITDTTIAQIAKIRPVIVSSGQGAVSQELIAKVKNSIVFLNSFNELLELGSVENIATIQQTPLSDPIKPDFLAASFIGGAIRFWHNNLIVTAAASGRTFILSFREGATGTKSFWQPPQILPIGATSDYKGNLIGHSPATTESYKMFDGTNDNEKPIVFKAHFAYNNYGMREKLKNFDKYFSELYLSANAIINHSILFEYLASKAMRTFQYKGSEIKFIFVPNPQASLGVNSLGTSPLGAQLGEPQNLLKYRRFKKVTPTNFFEVQVRYECDELDAQFQILSHGANPLISTIAPASITN